MVGFIYYFLVVGIGLYIMLTRLANKTHSAKLEEAIQKKPRTFLAILVVNILWPLTLIIMFLLLAINFIYNLTTKNKDER